MIISPLKLPSIHLWMVVIDPARPGRLLQHGKLAKVWVGMLQTSPLVRDEDGIAQVFLVLHLVKTW